MLANTPMEMSMDKTKPREPRDPESRPSSNEGSVKHVVRTGLPPGVDVEDVKDPGRNAPKGPTDNRS